ncbi:Rv0909 family putative TA system antitoxin [Nonomuraea sp. NPDC050310]|uniref:Rv0909 family putative TA system antitoxin n=1 Tax=Nonomuraea sp. NPDC050310 TaxID=3154935 RepID=UPI003409051F
MSIFDKVKEMFNDASDKARNVPEQAAGTADDGGARTRQSAGGAGSKVDGLREKAEDAARSGIDKAAAAASEATGGKYDEHLAKGADAARRAADRIDGKEG